MLKSLFTQSHKRKQLDNKYIANNPSENPNQSTIYYQNVKQRDISITFSSSENKNNHFSSIMEETPESTTSPTVQQQMLGTTPDAKLPPVSPASSSSVPTSPGGTSSEVLKMVARVLRNMEGVTSKNSERLRFLDPELKSTQSRIEVLEIMCHANEDKLNHLSTDLAIVQNEKDTKNQTNDRKNGKEILTNNYFHTSKLKETSRTERLSSKETNTKYIIERHSDSGHNQHGNTQKDNEENTGKVRSKFSSHDNIMQCCLSGEDDVFVNDLPMRKHESEPYMVNPNDPKTSNFMKRLWGYEEIPERISNLVHKFPSHMTIDHDPTEDCYKRT